jgi:hypothetical protein
MHYEDIERDLLVTGIDIRALGSPTLTWRRLAALIERIPPTSTSALAWTLAAEKNAYPVDVELLAAIADAVIGANWQRSDDGVNGRNRPHPLPRPGDSVDAGEDAILAKVAAFRARQRERQTRG